MSKYFAMCMVALTLFTGCQPELGNDQDIEALAKTWPAYRRPVAPDNTVAPDAPAPNQIGATSPPPRAISPRAISPRGQRPILEREMPVLRSYRTWNLQETALDALGRIGRPAVQELVRALREPDPQVRFQAAEVLARIGPVADEAVPSLVAALNDGDVRVRKAAARALGQIGPAADEAVAPLMQFLGNRTPADNRPSINP